MILSPFCDLVHAKSVVDLFAKQLNNARERAQNHKKTGKITKIRAFDGRFSPNARLDGHARLKTSVLGTLVIELFAKQQNNALNMP